VTLPELLVVISIVAILAALVLPKVRIDNAQVDSAARTIGLTLMAAQRDAAARQHDVVVVFDTASHLIRTIWDANNNGMADANEKSRLFLLPERVILGRPSTVPAIAGDAGTTLRGLPAGPYLVMQRNGATDRAVVLYLTTRTSMAGAADPDARAVTIARATGRPSWYAWTGSTWRRGL
jgi:prepilin-type N-terminal cleavage/methylation domain-containing protein